MKGAEPRDRMVAGCVKNENLPTANEAPVRFTAGGVKWLVQKDWHAELSSDFYHRLGSGEDPPGSRLVKAHKVRKILFMNDAGPGGEGLFIKCHVHRGLGQALRYLLWPSKARREWRISRALIEEGLPAARALGYGERRRWGILKNSYYLSECINEGTDLHQWWKSEEGTVQTRRRRVIDRLALLLKELHDRNFFPADFHLGNVIVCGGEGGADSLHLIDLDGVRRVRRLKKSHRLTNLVQVNNADPDLEYNYRLQFLKSYADRCAPHLREMLSDTGKIEKLTRRFRDRQHRRRTRRCLTGKYIFGRRKIDNLTVYHRLDFEPHAALGVIDDYREAPIKKGIRFLKTDHSRTILTLPLKDCIPKAEFGEDPERVCIKHFRYQGILRAFKDLFRTSKGRRSWVAGNAFILRGVPTGMPLALVEKRRWGLLKESFLIMQDLSQFMGIPWYVLENFRGLDSQGTAVRRGFIKALAGSLLKLHEMNIYHGDLKSTNILVEETGGGWRFHYIDLDGVRIGKKVSLRRRAKNLAQIETSTPGCMSLSDRIRFFILYMRGMDPVVNRRELLRLVQAEVSKRLYVW